MSTIELLSELGLDKHAGPLLEHSIQKCSHLLECSITDLMELGNLTYEQAHAARDGAAAKLSPAFVSMDVLLASQQARTPLPTGMPELDAAMGGGLLNGCITELVGPSGIGKSQFCASLAAQAALPTGADSAVLYIDTEMKLSLPRLAQIMQQRILTASRNTHLEAEDTAQDHSTSTAATTLPATSLQVQALMQRVHVLRPSTGHDLMQILKRLQAELQQRSFAAIILDSIAVLMRVEYDNRQVAARQRQLAEQASLLKRTAEHFNIPIVCTNQITAADSGGVGQQRAALGVVWAHAVSTRLVLDYAGEHRRVRIAKCPVAANVAAAYTIGYAGVQPTHAQLPHMPTDSVLAANIAAERAVMPADQL